MWQIYADISGDLNLPTSHFTSKGKKLTKYAGCVDAYVKKAEKNRKTNDEKVGE